MTKVPPPHVGGYESQPREDLVQQLDVALHCGDVFVMTFPQRRIGGTSRQVFLDQLLFIQSSQCDPERALRRVGVSLRKTFQGETVADVATVPNLFSIFDFEQGAVAFETTEAGRFFFSVGEMRGDGGALPA